MLSHLRQADTNWQAANPQHDVEQACSDHLRGDLFGGLTAAIIALPMALAFAVASGAGPVAVGIFVANVLTIERMIRIQSESIKAINDAEGADHLSFHEQTLLEGAEGRVLVFALGVPLFFGIAKAISRQHAVLPDHKVLIMDFTDVPLLGVSSSLALEKLILDDLHNGRDVHIVGAHGSVEQRLKKFGILDTVHAEHIISTRKTALELAAIAMKQRDETDASGSPNT